MSVEELTAFCEGSPRHAAETIAALDQRVSELTEERDRYRDVIETKVARFMCPVHGSDNCPEDYMRTEFDGWSRYRDEWSEGMRCGQRPMSKSVLRGIAGVSS